MIAACAACGQEFRVDELVVTAQRVSTYTDALGVKLWRGEVLVHHTCPPKPADAVECNCLDDTITPGMEHRNSCPAYEPPLDADEIRALRAGALNGSCVMTADRSGAQ